MVVVEVQVEEKTAWTGLGGARITDKAAPVSAGGLPQVLAGNMWT